MFTVNLSLFSPLAIAFDADSDLCAYPCESKIFCYGSYVHKMNSQIKRFGCGFCDTFFDSNTELVAHHKEQHKCEFCNFTYKTIKAKQKHLKSLHLLKCCECGLYYTTKLDLQIHKVTLHNYYKCELCYYTTKFKSNANNHKKNLHPEKSKKRKPENLTPNAKPSKKR